MENRRQHQRVPMSVDIKIQHPDIGEKIIKTKNLSDGGIFVLVEPTAMPPIGAVVIGQVQGLTEDPPVLEMEVVRHDKDGVGLRFLFS